MNGAVRCWWIALRSIHPTHESFPCRDRRVDEGRAAAAGIHRNPDIQYAVELTIIEIGIARPTAMLISS